MARARHAVLSRVNRMHTCMQSLLGPQGLQPGDYPPQLTQFGADVDAQSLFWKARRVQALVMQVRACSCQVRKATYSIRHVRRRHYRAPQLASRTCKRALCCNGVHAPQTQQLLPAALQSARRTLLLWRQACRTPLLRTSRTVSLLRGRVCVCVMIGRHEPRDATPCAEGLAAPQQCAVPAGQPLARCTNHSALQLSCSYLLQWRRCSSPHLKRPTQLPPMQRTRQRRTRCGTGVEGGLFVDRDSL